MSKIALVTDSTCSMPKDLIENMNINCRPPDLNLGKRNF